MQNTSKGSFHRANPALCSYKPLKTFHRQRRELEDTQDTQDQALYLAVGSPEEGAEKDERRGMEAEERL